MIVDFHRCKGKKIRRAAKKNVPCKITTDGKCRENAGKNVQQFNNGNIVENTT
jgi:hypothetical protein